VTGNPNYPLAFGGKWWTPTAQHGVEDIRLGYGFPHASVARLLILPIDLILHGGRFDGGRYVGTAIFLAALCVWFARRRRAALLVLAGAVVYAVAWWETSQQVRFLVPALVAAAAVGGAGVAGLIARHPPARAPLLVVLAAATAVWAVSSIALTRQLIPVAFGAESRSHFLQRLTGTYDTFRRVQARVDGELGLIGYPFAFNYPGRALGLESPAFTPTVPRAEYVRRLRAYGVKEVLVSDDSYGHSVATPIAGCADPIATYHARFVKSRARGTSIPLTLTLESTRAC
jgi:hypothetical protein